MSYWGSTGTVRAPFAIEGGEPHFSVAAAITIKTFKNKKLTNGYLYHKLNEHEGFLLQLSFYRAFGFLGSGKRFLLPSTALPSNGRCSTFLSLGIFNKIVALCICIVEGSTLIIYNRLQVHTRSKANNF